MIYVRPEARDCFAGERTVDDFLRIPCEVVRRFKNRRMGRFVRNGRAFYIKVHDSGGWWPIADELLHFRLPEVGARPEWRALRAARARGIPAPRVVAFGEEGRAPASQRSFLITDEIAPTVSLEALALDRANLPVGLVLKRRLVREVAAIARTLHSSGMNHRDFYLCHFLLNGTAAGGGSLGAMSSQRPSLYLIDLHRAQIRGRIPQRWIVKDLGGLVFSAMDAGLSARDLALFVRCYSGKPFLAAIRDQRAFWRAVRRRAESLYRKCHHRSPTLDLSGLFEL
jgi:heptose I phosphotransferase